MNKQMLCAVMVNHGDTQGTLADALSIARSTLNRKINGDAEFGTDEVARIIKRYKLKAKETYEIFFADRVS